MSASFDRLARAILPQFLSGKHKQKHVMFGCQGCRHLPLWLNGNLSKHEPANVSLDFRIKNLGNSKSANKVYNDFPDILILSRLKCVEAMFNNIVISIQKRHLSSAPRDISQEAAAERLAIG